MILDIVEIQDDSDLILNRSDAARAANILSVQLGNLEYALDFGVDFNYFLQEDFQFQNESFKAYLVQRLAEHQVNVSRCTELVNKLVTNFTFEISDPTTQGLIS